MGNEDIDEVEASEDALWGPKRGVEREKAALAFLYFAFACRAHEHLSEPMNTLVCF